MPFPVYSGFSFVFALFLKEPDKQIRSDASDSLSNLRPGQGWKAAD